LKPLSSLGLCEAVTMKPAQQFLKSTVKGCQDVDTARTGTKEQQEQQQ